MRSAQKTIIIIIIIIIIINVIPRVTEETGTISESIIKCLSHVPDKHDFKELQKTAILVTAHILRKTVR